MSASPRGAAAQADAPAAYPPLSADAASLRGTSCQPTSIENPVINSPFVEPAQHFRGRRRPGHAARSSRGAGPVEFFVPVAKPKKASAPARARCSSAAGRASSRTRSSTRSARRSPDGGSRATRTRRATTRELLAHWRAEDRERRLFFCQIEAAETAIYLTEAAEKIGDTKALNVIRAGERPPQRRPAAARLQDGDRLRQDRRHGDAHRLAGAQQAREPVRQALQPALPDRHPRHHDPRPPPRPAAQRSRQLLPRDGHRHAGAARPAPGGDDRDHQLPRLHPPREDRGGRA